MKEGRRRAPFVPKQKGGGLLRLTRRGFFVGCGLIALGIPAIALGETCLIQEDLPQKYYPELNSVAPREKGSFGTAGGKDIKWYNYTDLTVNASAAQSLYQYYEGLAAQARTGSIPLGSRVVRYQTLPKPYKKIGVFLVDSTAPDPSWAKDNFSGAMTFSGYTREVSLTNIKTIAAPPGSSGIAPQLFPSIEDYADYGLLVEAAQASFNVVSVDQSTSDQAQEAFCNSYALALYLKQRKSSYPEYIQKTSVSIHLPGDISVPPIRLSESQYANLPLFPALIKAK